MRLAVGLLATIAAAQPAVEYERQVHPLLAAKCFVCHSQEKRSGGFSLATYGDLLEGGRSGAAVKPGNSGASLIIQRTNGTHAPRMPLGAAPLSAAEIAILSAWIDEGARATPASAPARPKWEAPLALASPAIPAVGWKTWQSPLDRFVADYLGKHGVAEPEPVSDAVFARRVYLDVIGLLPAPGELQRFLSDGRADKRERLVQTLLAENRAYAENWISFWNDLLRNDEGVNYFSEAASRKSITPWLLNSLRTNLAYDQFVRELLNPTAPSDPAGFLIGVNWRGVVNASQTPAMQAAQNTAQIFLGINLKCNSCHDSFISKWKLKDAYALASYFSPEEKLQLYRCDVAQAEFAEPGFLFPELNHAAASSSEADRRAAAAAIFTDPGNGRLARTLVNRIWHRLLGRGIVENPDEMDGEPWSPELLDWLAADFAGHGYDIKRLIATILNSRAYQMPAVRAGSGSYVFRGPELRRLTAEQFADAIGAITGDWRVYQPPMPPTAPGAPPLTPPPGVYSRDWHLAANPLTRALGRPIRDQVYGTRDNQATTLQALELVNGETLTHWLMRGARKMLGVLPPEPVSVFDKPITGRLPAPPEFDIDISRARRLWLLVQDTGSYSPEKVEAAWANVELAGREGATLLSSLKPVDSGGLRPGEGPIELNGFHGDGVRVKTPSRLVYDIAGRGFTRLRGMVGIENREISSDINPRTRFFIFLEEPAMDRLTHVEPETPVPGLPPVKSAEEAVDRVFWYALGRAPSAGEREAAGDVMRPEGLADLLWAVMMKPEFQLVR
uniref:Cytochrome c domain-containing protein n=1 Tax=Solibacter usitatus (strain Ellin6076) TaxID=234267 RepID=Q01NB1_SOLUE